MPLPGNKPLACQARLPSVSPSIAPRTRTHGSVGAPESRALFHPSFSSHYNLPWFSLYSVLSLWLGKLQHSSIDHRLPRPPSRLRRSSISDKEPLRSEVFDSIIAGRSRSHTDCGRDTVLEHSSSYNTTAYQTSTSPATCSGPYRVPVRRAS